MNNKPTFGQQYVDNAKKNTDNGMINVLELAAQMKENFMPNVLDVVDKNYNKYPGDFYVVVAERTEKLFDKKAFRDQFFDTQDCPTPNYDQHVFRYNKQKGQLEHWWTIPDRDTCLYLLQHYKELPPEEHQLLSWVFQFATGQLHIIMKKLNGEKIETPELDKKDIKVALT